jgi:hypothetical protein
MCLAAAGGLEAVREATVHDIARTPGSSPGIGVRRQINAARDNSGPPQMMVLCGGREQPAQ